MKVRDVTIDMPFRFVGSALIYISRGDGWYSSPSGYDGGPWANDTREIEEVPTRLHSHSFDGFNTDELRNIARQIFGTEVDRWHDGDRALVEYEYRKRRDRDED